MEWLLLNSIHSASDVSLHFSAISFPLTVYVTEGENTPVELPVALPVFVCSGGDYVENFPVELPG